MQPQARKVPDGRAVAVAILTAAKGQGIAPPKEIKLLPGALPDRSLWRVVLPETLVISKEAPLESWLAAAYEWMRISIERMRGEARGLRARPGHGRNDSVYARFARLDLDDDEGSIGAAVGAVPRRADALTLGRAAKVELD